MQRPTCIITMVNSNNNAPLFITDDTDVGPEVIPVVGASNEPVDEPVEEPMDNGSAAGREPVHVEPSGQGMSLSSKLWSSSFQCLA